MMQFIVEDMDKFDKITPLIIKSSFKVKMDYFTPVKEGQVMIKAVKTTTQTREGDWVCLNCNNLNFSFRKKCNRCKMQTREQNQATSAFSYYYYPKQYLYVPHNMNDLNAKPNTPTSANSPPNSQSFNTPIQNKENQTPPKLQKQLPSVSPLIKKYNSREILSESSKSSSSSSVWGVRDFEDALAASNRSDDGELESDEDSDDLEKLIGKIML